MDYRELTRTICQTEGLTQIMIEGSPASSVLMACIEVESGYNPRAIHLNIDKNGNVSSIDFGIVQINDFFQIGIGKPFPSPEYVLNHPQECIQWMASLFKAGKQNLWASFSTKAYKKFLKVDQ